MNFSKTQYYRFRITNKPDIAGWKAKLSTVCKVPALFYSPKTDNPLLGGSKKRPNRLLKC